MTKAQPIARRVSLLRHTLSLPLLAVYALAMWIGAHGFRYSTDAGFRHAALALCAVSAIAGLPIW